MTIKNAKKIEVWQFKEEDGGEEILLPKGIVYYDEREKIYRHNKYYEPPNGESLIRKHFAELEAKEQESESSEWVEFKSMNDSGLIGFYRTNDNGKTFEYNGSLGWVSLPDYSRDKTIKFIYENYVKPKQESEWVEFEYTVEDTEYDFRTKNGKEFEVFSFDGWCWESDMNQFLDGIKEYYENYVKPKPKQEEPVSELEMRIAVQEELLGNVVDTITDLRSRITFLEQKDKHTTRHIFELNKVLNNIQLEIMNHTKGMNFKTNPYKDNV